MEGTISLRVSAQEVFQMFVDQLKKDALVYCGISLSDADIKEGLHYRKDLTMNETHPNFATITLLKYEPYRRYTLVYETDKTRIQVQYDMNETQDDHVDIFYQEIKTVIHQEQGLQERKQQTSLSFFKRRQFRALEKAIIKNRKN